MDLDQSTTETTTMEHSINATDASSSDVSMPNILNVHPHLRGIGIAHTHIYVISLADRQDRREQMEFLHTIQELKWTVIDAIPGNATLVSRILDWVTLQHAESNKMALGASGFHWLEETNALSASLATPLNPSGSDTWADTSPSSKPKSSKSGPFTSQSLLCENDTPEWMVLSTAKIACWHSHISAIRRFVDAQDAHNHRREDDVAIMLEDDIDMEKDISTRPSQVWTFLPAGWDIVFLGTYDDSITRMSHNASGLFAF